MLLTLSIVTLAAIQGYTGTDVDERTGSADIGADIQVQFVDPVSKEQAETAIIAAIERTNDDEINKIIQDEMKLYIHSLQILFI